MNIKNQIFLLFGFILIAISCDEKSQLETSESIYKPAIVEFLNEFTQSNSQDNIDKINALSHSIDFRNVYYKRINEFQEIIIADIIASSTITDACVLKAVFITSNKKITVGNITSFTSNDDNGSKDYNLLLTDFIQGKTSNQLTGKVSVFNLYEKEIFNNTYSNGRIIAHGNVQDGSAKKIKGSRAQGCIDWYLVTTVYYNGGGSSSSSEYLYTTCDCVNYSTRTSATMCGGGDGGGGGGQGGSSGTLPSNPANGDRVFISLPDGRTIIYRAEMDDAGIRWVIVAVTLPSVIVTAASTYNFLPPYPYNNQIVVGTDGMIYEYNASWAQWAGYLDDYLEINRRFGLEYINKFRIPLSNTSVAGLTDQQVIDQIKSKMANLDVENRLLNDTENRYYLRPVQFTISVGNPPTSTTTTNVVDPSQWTLDPIFGNPGTLTSPDNSAAIALFPVSGNVIYITVYFQKTQLL